MNCVRQPAALLMACLVTLAGCGVKESDGGGSTSAGTGVRQGSIRFVNAIDDAPTISAVLRSVQSDAEAVFGDSAYGEATALTGTDVGEYEMDLVYLTPSDDKVTLVAGETIDLTQYDEVSLFLVGDLNNYQLLRTDNVAISKDVDTSDSTTWPDPQIQIVDASQTAGRVDVYVISNKAPLVTSAPTATVDFAAVTPLASIDPSITYRVVVTPEGSKSVLFDSGDISFARITRTVLMLIDQFEPESTVVRVVQVSASGSSAFADQDLGASVRFSNLVSDVAAVDVFFGDTAGTPVFANIPFGVTTSYLKLDSNTVDFPYSANLNVTPVGVQNRFVFQGPITLQSGQANTLYVAGDTSNADIDVKSDLLTDTLRSIASEVQLRIVNGAASAGTVDAYLLPPGQPTVDASPALDDAALLGSSVTSRDPGLYDLTVTDSNGELAVFGPERLDLQLGGIYTATIIESPGGGPPIRIQLDHEATN